jgi:imidazolonepropionase-like amidohydrolase
VDVVIVDGNPTTDIKALHSVNTIVAQGSVVKRDGVLQI